MDFKNLLLRRLGDADRSLLSQRLAPVQVKLRETLEHADTPIKTVYFLESGVASIVAKSAGDRVIEAGLFGCDGMTGVSLLMGDDRSSNETFMQVDGSAHRIAAADFTAALDASPTLRLALLPFVQALLVQTAHTALADGRAKIEERLARWLLMAHDRMPGDELRLTHEFLALMLGVRRPGVTVALHFLEGRGLIKASRGQLTIIDRAGLIGAADGSYGVPEAEYERLIGVRLSKPSG